MKIEANKKIKLIRIVTQAEVVPWHLKNFIERSEKDYDLYIIGNGVTKYKSEFPFVTFFDVDILRKTSLLYDLTALFQLLFLYIKIRPDIVHSIMPKAGFLSSLAGFLAFVPIRIHTFTGQVWSTKLGFSREFYRYMDKVILKLCTKCLTDSPSQSNFLADSGLRKNNSTIECLGQGSLSGVDLRRFDVELIKNKDVLRSELNILSDDFVYVFLARKSIIKGIKYLFESFSKIAYLPKVKLLFIGPDESEGVLDELFEQYRDIANKIISIGAVKKHEDYLAISDVLCLPSSSEGFGSIVVEAAAMGVPSIGFNIVGLIDAIEDNYTGVLVPFGNVDEFSVAMLSLYNDKEKLEKMKNNARKRVLDYFSADAVYEFQNQFYMRLIEEKHNK